MKNSDIQKSSIIIIIIVIVLWRAAYGANCLLARQTCMKNGKIRILALKVDDL